MASFNISGQGRVWGRWREGERRKRKPILVFASEINLVPSECVCSISVTPSGSAQNSKQPLLSLPPVSLCPAIATHFVRLPTPQDPPLDPPGGPRGSPLGSPWLGAVMGL